MADDGDERRGVKLQSAEFQRMRKASEEQAPMRRGWLSPLRDIPKALRKRVDGARGPSGEDAMSDPMPKTGMSTPLLTFIALVLVPAFAGALYFAFIATDQYIAETRFAVRAVEADVRQTPASGEGSSTTTATLAFTPSSQNAYIVSSYIHSRAILDDLGSHLNLREIFRRPEADFWARLKQNASIDELTDYWNVMVMTNVDSLSGIVTVKLRAFRQDDAMALGAAVIAASEALVNRISDRARRDATLLAEKELRRAYEGVQAALADLGDFRNKSGIIDPSVSSSEIGKLLAPLMADKIRLESQLFVASRELGAESPSIRLLLNQITAVGEQIASLKERLTRSDDKAQALSASLARFEELELQRKFAEKLYAIAQTDLDRAQLRASRQNVYLSVFVPPSLPEDSRYPRRVAFPILIFMALGIFWSIGALLVASIEDHRL